MSSNKTHMNFTTQLKSAQVIKSRSPRVTSYEFLGSFIVLYFDNGTDQLIPQHEWQPLAQEWIPTMNT